MENYDTEKQRLTRALETKGFQGLAIERAGGNGALMLVTQSGEQLFGDGYDDLLVTVNQASNIESLCKTLRDKA